MTFFTHRSRLGSPKTEDLSWPPGVYWVFCVPKTCFLGSKMISKHFWSISKMIKKISFLSSKEFFDRNFWLLGTSPNLPKWCIWAHFSLLLSLWGHLQPREMILGCSGCFYHVVRHQIDLELAGFVLKMFRKDFKRLARICFWITNHWFRSDCRVAIFHNSK